VSRLILVRHAAPVIDADKPSADWPLSDAGRGAAAALAEQIAPLAPAVLVSGAEPKMIGTASAIGDRLGMANTPLERLNEHARRSTPFGDRESFRASIQGLFSRPGERIYGDESADETYGRWAAAMDRVLALARGRPVVAVSGGTAISLFVSRRTGIDPFAFWKALRLPQAFVLATEPWRIEETIG